ncbi:MAG: FtsB family cell division protein [Polaribacter sp.]|jgi:cell division protein FtsB
MSFKELKENKIFKFFTNIFVLIVLVFAVWMTFFDENSYLVHREFNKEIDELEKTIKFYEDQIKEDKTTIKKLQDSLELERFAREKYLMKKKNEDIYLIEFDTVK